VTSPVIASVKQLTLPLAPPEDEARAGLRREDAPVCLPNLLERALERSNMFRALRRVRRRRRVSGKALKALRRTVKEKTRRTLGVSFRSLVTSLSKTLLGWRSYYGFNEVPSPLQEVEKWIRRRLRCYLWKQWGRRGYRELKRRGVRVDLAWNTAKSAHGPWRLSQSPALTIALSTRYFRLLGLPRLVNG
jgi:RNA-directed DNA polymerase